MNDSVKQRLIDFLAFKKISKSEFGRRIGVSSAFVSSMRKSIQPDKIKSIAIEFPDLNTEWLLTGEGEMLKITGDQLQVKSESVGNEIPIQIIPLLPISAQGGTLNDFVVSVKGSDCERVVSPVRGADFAITVSGDSMAPEYPSGSQVIIKKINERAFIDWGKVYVLDTCNGVVVKRLMPADDGDASKVKCVSINPSYPPFEVNLLDVYGVYRVMLCMAMK